MNGRYFGRVEGNDDFITHFQSLSIPTHPGPVVRTVAFDGPTFDLAFVVFDVDKNLDVRVRPLVFGYDRFSGDGCFRKVIRYAGSMMCKERASPGTSVRPLQKLRSITFFSSDLSLCSAKRRHSQAGSGRSRIGPAADDCLCSCVKFDALHAINVEVAKKRVLPAAE